nr:hypothetical protein [Elizabethkingia sp. ASV34]
MELIVVGEELEQPKVWFSYSRMQMAPVIKEECFIPVSYTHLRAHET